VDAGEIARGYKALAEIERGWRDLKQLELRPVYHRTDDRIVAHVQLSWLALLLIRTAELACRDTWRNLSHELDRIQLHTYNTGAGTVSQRTLQGDARGPHLHLSHSYAHSGDDDPLHRPTFLCSWHTCIQANTCETTRTGPRPSVSAATSTCSRHPPANQLPRRPTGGHRHRRVRVRVAVHRRRARRGDVRPE
jgi:hypothetical protein